ncbi:MAG: ribonuclease P protein component [Dehalococcoidales bacterium]|jgi:ribonuclease P protein component
MTDRLPAGKIPFSLVYEQGKSWAGKEIVVRALANGLEASRFGFAVSRRLGGAVVRNRVKRRLREIIRRKQIKPGWDIIIIARTPAVTAGFMDLSQSVGRLLDRAGLAAGENEGDSPRTD